jgi:hypothetical protein
MTLALPPLLCSHCGACDVPTIAAGTGPHVAKAICSACQGFIKWLPKMMLKETSMIANVNRVVLLGTIGKYGMEMRYSNNGTGCASFMLAVTEHGQDGKDHATLIPCECWGKRSAEASDLKAGQLVLFEGRLRRRQQGEQWETFVSGFEVTPIRASAEDPS